MAGGWTQQGVPHMGELVAALVSVAGYAALTYVDRLLDPPASFVVFTVHDLFFCFLSILFSFFMAFHHTRLNYQQSSMI